jgi:GAF domain-containing protein
MSTNRSQGEWHQVVRQQAALARVGQLGLEGGDVDRFLQECLLVAADTLGLGDVVLFELGPDGADIRGRVGLDDGRFRSRRSMRKVSLPVGRGSLPGFAVTSAAPVVADDLLHDERFTARAPERGVPVLSAMAAPIAWESTAFGAFVVYDRVLRRWTDDEVQFLRVMASTIGLALQRAEIEQDLRDSTSRLDLSLQAGGLGAWSWDLVGDRLTLSATALAMFGVAPHQFSGRGRDWLALVHPEDRAGMPRSLDGVEGSGIQHLMYRMIRPDTGEVRWIESWGRSFVHDDGDARLIGVLSDVTDRHRAEQVREELLAREHDARLEAERARERLGFLAEASVILSSSLDPDELLERIAELCVPALADLCFVDLLDDDGSLVEAAARATTAEGLDAARSVRRRRQQAGKGAVPDTGHQQALTGAGLVYEDITDELWVLAASDPGHLAALRRAQVCSTILVPMVQRGRAIGVLTLARTDPNGPRYRRDEDLPFAEDLAARAAMAVENARLYSSRARVARSLQAALLPPALPSIDGIEFAARYDVAEADVEIGGDFYDVMSVGPTSWGVVVGDVCGRGPDAAALTGLVRHSLRTAVVEGGGPAQVLDRTNRAVLAQIDDARFCTAAFLRIDVGGHGPVRVHAASAGHPLPVLVRTDGEVVPLACGGTLLGVVDELDVREVSVELHPGDAIVLYTDGLTEARRGGEWYGERRLLDALRALAGRRAADIAVGLEASVAEFRRSARDDTAVLVVQAAVPA